jgi:hypothetical protein
VGLLAGCLSVAFALALTGTVAAQDSSSYRVQREAWSDADERGYSEFIQALGRANCRTIDQCLKNPANPFARSDPPGSFWRADCADLPYFLRGYYAWKRGLPFSYINAVSPKGGTRDIRYTVRGNDIASRRDSHGLDERAGFADRSAQHDFVGDVPATSGYGEHRSLSDAHRPQVHQAGVSSL